MSKKRNWQLQVLMLAATLVVGACRSVAPPPAAELAPRIANARSIMSRPDVAAAMKAVDAERDAIVSEWRALTEIPAPSGHEEKRADRIETLLRKYGLSNVHRDSAGNVIGTRKGTGSGPHVVFDAHLDTVFPANTPLTTRLEGGRIYAPGVGDDTRNVEALLAMIRAMNVAQVRTAGDLTFVFTVEEETNFRGVEQFLADNAKDIDRYVTLDGGYSGFTYGGIGSYWYRYHFIGPGGHTRSAQPPYSATLPVARSIVRLSRLRLPSAAYLNVGMLGAGDVFNAKASDAWFSVDIRSNDAATLERLNRLVAKIVDEEARRAGMTTKQELVSHEKVASLPGHRHSEMVKTTEAVFRAFGFDPEISNMASNHTSAALLAGVPAIGTGSGICERTHSLAESCDVDSLFNGIKRNIVLAVALTESKN